jgi:hypothetical protein
MILNTSRDIFKRVGCPSNKQRGSLLWKIFDELKILILKSKNKLIVLKTFYALFLLLLYQTMKFVAHLKFLRQSL